MIKSLKNAFSNGFVRKQRISSRHIFPKNIVFMFHVEHPGMRVWKMFYVEHLVEYGLLKGL